MSIISYSAHPLVCYALGAKLFLEGAILTPMKNSAPPLKNRISPDEKNLRHASVFGTNLVSNISIKNNQFELFWC